MSNSSINVWSPLLRKDVESLICFWKTNPYMNNLQVKGTHALWNTLCRDELRFAYLADEVGMGKTYQALGVISLLLSLNPKARIVILCPGDEMQRQWSSDWHSFFQQKFMIDGMDGVLRSLCIHANKTESFEPMLHPCVCNNLREFATKLIMAHNSVFLLRYPSFSTPIRAFDWSPFQKDDNATETASTKDLHNCFVDLMNGIGCYITMDELVKEKLPEQCSKQVATHFYSRCFVEKLKILMRNFIPNLIVWDEAQYLRTDAMRNDAMRTLFGPHLYDTECRHLFLSATPAHRDTDDINKLNELFPASDKKRIQVQEGDQGACRASVERWMVRREREFNGIGKQEYRNYKTQPVDLFSDGTNPLFALTIALTQKKLVQLLKGGNNKFRMGEISSHESARASIVRYVKGKKDSMVLEESSSKENSEPIDENYLTELGKSFDKLTGSKGHKLPHLKVNQVVDDLARQCLSEGSANKELVFVRRIDTVDELADLLEVKFQNILDERIRLLSDNKLDPNDYWKMKSETDDDQEGEEEDTQVRNKNEPKTNYANALRAKKGDLGRLTAFRNTLGKEGSALHFLLLEKIKEDELISWKEFCNALGIYPFPDPDKDLLLRRCLAHSIRFTDILVDLDVLRKIRSIRNTGYLDEWISYLHTPPKGLETYFINTKAKLKAWSENFDTIINKCFMDSMNRNSYREIAERVSKYFVGLSPVARRSGHNTAQNVVHQFKFPIYPNVLVCTDVLREGVNLHLFCERITHYGIAWTSGDTEQRIGRVERADSLFERNIRRNEEHKLDIAFPYLAQTLDERQVNKALSRKKHMDALFSIVPPKETGECDDSKESLKKSSSSSEKHKPLDLVPSVDDLLKNVLERGSKWKKDAQALYNKWKKTLEAAVKIASEFIIQDENGSEFQFVACHMIKELDLLMLQWERLTGNRKEITEWNVCDKVICGNFNGRIQWKIIRTLYLPDDIPVTNELIASFWEMAKSQTCGTSFGEKHDDFKYCNQKKTHRKSYEIAHPFLIDQIRRQNIHLRRWASEYVLTSDICNSEDVESEHKSVADWISQINQHLPFGCATVIDDCVVLSMPVIHKSEWSPDNLKHAALMLAHWADRHQWCMAEGQDDDEFSIQPTKISGILQMNTQEALAEISRMKTWYSELVTEINQKLDWDQKWRNTSLEKIIETGKILYFSPQMIYSGEGTCQVAFEISGLLESPESKKFTCYLAVRTVIERVRNDDMPEIPETTKDDFREWLEKNDYSTFGESSDYTYGVKDVNNKQDRRMRFSIPIAQLEPNIMRDTWTDKIAKILEKLRGNVFQYKSFENEILCGEN